MRLDVKVAPRDFSILSPSAYLHEVMGHVETPFFRVSDRIIASVSGFALSPFLFHWFSFFSTPLSYLLVRFAFFPLKSRIFSCHFTFSIKNVSYKPCFLARVIEYENVRMRGVFTELCVRRGGCGLFRSSHGQWLLQLAGADYGRLRCFTGSGRVKPP